MVVGPRVISNPNGVVYYFDVHPKKEMPAFPLHKQLDKKLNNL